VSHAVSTKIIVRSYPTRLRSAILLLRICILPVGFQGTQVAMSVSVAQLRLSTTFEKPYHSLFFVNCSCCYHVELHHPSTPSFVPPSFSILTIFLFLKHCRNSIPTQDRFNQSPVHNPTQRLGQDISNIQGRLTVEESDCPNCNHLPNPVICACMYFLLELRRRNCCVQNDRLIVSEHIRWAIQGESHRMLYLNSIAMSVAIRAATNSDT
jgi:hypothetical protein